MNEVQIFSKPEFGMIRTTTDDQGMPWFNAVDVCRALGLANVTNALKRYVDEPDLRKTKTRSSGQVREANFVNESGLYALIFGSKRQNAKDFKRWVTCEVLPCIRKTGAYMTDAKAADLFDNPQNMEELAKQVTEAKAEMRKLRYMVEQFKPKARIAEALEGSVDSILVRDLAKLLCQNGLDIGEVRLYRYLRANGYLCGHGESYNRPTQWSTENGWFEVKWGIITYDDGTTRQIATTKVTGKGQKYFLDKLLNLSPQAKPMLL